MTARTSSLPFTLDAVGGLPALEGVLTFGPDGIAVVAPPHPLMGGAMSSPVVQSLAEGIRRAGLGTLVFNFRGVGESHGSPSGNLDDAAIDYRTALRAALKSTTTVVAAGYSFGGAAAIRVSARDTRIARVIVVAPPPALLDAADLAALGARLTVIAGEADTVALAPDLQRLTLAAGATYVSLAGEGHFFTGAQSKLAELAEAAVAGLLA